MKNKKIVIIGLFLIVAIFLFVRSKGGSTQAQYKFARVSYGNVEQLISASGNVSPVATVDVFPAIKGKIAKVYVANGDEIDAEDNLFKVTDPATGQEDVVTAPAGGTILNLSVDVGARVSPVSNSANAAGGGNPVPTLVIADLSGYSVKLQINEVYIDKIKVDQEADVKFDALGGKTATASVDRVDEIGTNTQGVITYNTYLSLGDTPAALRPMMTADVDIKTAKRRHVLTLPNSALVPYRGGKAVCVLNKKTGKVRQMPVKVGIVGILRSEITAGVESGQQVIIGTSSAAGRGFLSMRGPD